MAKEGLLILRGNDIRESGRIVDIMERELPIVEMELLSKREDGWRIYF
jgi:hypothetical protein